MTDLVSAADVLAALRARGETLGTAESLTGGLLGAAITSVPGASDVYLGGVISYATAVKQSLLGVPDELVAEHGVVSAECAAAMAVGVTTGSIGADWAISTTGVAGPDSQEGKPVGLVYVGLAGPSVTRVIELHLHGDRASIRAQAIESALTAVLQTIFRAKRGD